MELRGLLVCGALGLGGSACGSEPVGSGEAEATETTEATDTTGGAGQTSSSSGSESSESTTRGPDLGGEDCDWGHTENFVVLMGVTEGVTTWATVVEDETTERVPMILDLEGGVVFASLGDTLQLVRHAADGTRVATLPLAGSLHDLATDGSGRIVYVGIFEADIGFEMGYGEVDQSLTPLFPRRELPWGVSLVDYRVKLASAPDGTTVMAGGGARGSGRWISKVDADGNEVWTSAWPMASEPDDYGTGHVAGVAVLADGTVGMVLTSGDSYDGDLWLEAFDAAGQHAWTATDPNRKTLGVTATADTFVVTSKDQVDAYTADGVAAWSTWAELVSLARPCTDTSFVASTGIELSRFSPGGEPVAYAVDPYSFVQPLLEGHDGASWHVSDAICTPDGDVIVLADVEVWILPSGTCETGG